MSHYPTTYRDLTGNPSIEAMELADVGGFSGLRDDCNAEMDAAFGYGGDADELTEREIDALFVAEMERRDRDAATVFGGNGGDDDDRTPPAGGSALPVPDYAAHVATIADDALVEAVHIADTGTPGSGWLYMMGVFTEEQRRQYLAAATAELLRRMGDRPAAVAA